MSADGGLAPTLRLLAVARRDRRPRGAGEGGGRDGKARRDADVPGSPVGEVGGGAVGGLAPTLRLLHYPHLLRLCEKLSDGRTSPCHSRQEPQFVRQRQS
jgi:hypothetical protein